MFKRKLSFMILVEHFFSDIGHTWWYVIFIPYGKSLNESVLRRNELTIDK